MGVVGIICFICEMSVGGGVGMEIYFDCVFMCQENMFFYEILLFELQECMFVVIQKGKEQVVKDIFDKWDLYVEEIGMVMDIGCIYYYMQGEFVVDVLVELFVFGGGVL